MLSKFLTKRNLIHDIRTHNPGKILTQLLIDGKFVNSKSGKKFKTINPATEEVIAEVQEADKEDVDIAVAAAKKAFEVGPWRKMTGQEKGKLMFKLADLIDKHADELSVLESLDNGKPAHIAKAADLFLTSATIRYYAGYADKQHGQTIPVNGPFFVYTRHEPVGVCAQIIPWNFPLVMAAWKLGPVLATGCTTIIKPAEQTPLSILRLGELIMEAGFPDGVVNILPGYGPTAGASLAKHRDVDKIAFTGSTQVGMEIMRTSHVHNLKRITLELGGKSPNIVMDDADIDQAVQISDNAIFFNMGQCCAAGSRLFVHEKVYDEFLEKKIQNTKNRKVGNPLKESTDIGPLVDLEQRDKVRGFIEKGSKEGANIAFGGKPHKGKGYYVEPTIFTDVKDDMTIAKEEIFGPVVSILKFKTIDEVIKRANQSSYGLAAGIITRSFENAMKITNSLRTGTNWINCYNAIDTNTPFGGFKNSGVGRELGEYGLKNYQEVKTVVIKQSEDTLH
jgi:aldehyde dehydrogenase (NAD+)